MYECIGIAGKNSTTLSYSRQRSQPNIALGHLHRTWHVERADKCMGPALDAPDLPAIITIIHKFIKPGTFCTCLPRFGVQSEPHGHSWGVAAGTGGAAVHREFPGALRAFPFWCGALHRAKCAAFIRVGVCVREVEYIATWPLAWLGLRYRWKWYS